MTSNNTTHSFFAYHQHPSQAHPLNISRFHQTRKACNYIKEYYALQDAFNIPEISIANFYQKIHKLRSLIIEQYQNIFEFMQKQYPFSPMVTLNQTLCPNYLQMNKQIEETDTANFSFREHLDQQTKSLYFGQIVDGKRVGYAVYAEYATQNRQNYSLSSFYQGFFDQNLKEGFGIEWKQHSIYIGNFSKDKGNSNQISVILYQTGDIYVGCVKNNKKHGKGAFFKLKKKLNQYFKYQTSRKPLDYQNVVIGRWQKNSLAENSDFLMKKNIKELLQMSLFDAEANLLIQNHSIYCGDLIQKSEVSYGRQIYFVRNNKGVQYFVNGDLYQGYYEQNKPHGNGHYYWSTQEEYLGQFKEGLRSGNGRWIGSNAEQFEGQYKYDKRNGYGIYKWPNGDIYEGEFKDDIRNGLGRMSWSNGQIYVGHWQNGLQHGIGQIQVQLRCTNLHKKFLFEKGNPVIKKEENEEPQLQALMKSKFQYKNRVKEIKQHRRTSYKKEHQRQQVQNKISQKRQKTQHKEPQKARGKSLGQLRISKKLKLVQDQKRQKTQHKSSSLIDKSFLDYRRQLTLHESWENKRKKSTYIEADKVIANFQELKCESKLQPNLENQVNQEVKLSEPMQTNQDLRRSVTHELKLGKKLVFKKKHLFREKKPSETPLQMGDTLLKPIKWVNFKESWQKN